MHDAFVTVARSLLKILRITLNYNNFVVWNINIPILTDKEWSKIKKEKTWSTLKKSYIIYQQLTPFVLNISHRNYTLKSAVTFIVSLSLRDSRTTKGAVGARFYCMITSSQEPQS